MKEVTMSKLHCYPDENRDRRKRRMQYVSTIEEKMLQWLPDGRDVSDYPKPGETSLYQWAWEFLRRDRRYQYEYTILSEIPGEHETSQFRENFCHIYHYPYWLDDITRDETLMPRIRELINTKRSDFIKHYWLDRFSPELNPSLTSPPAFCVPLYPQLLDDILGRGARLLAEVPHMSEYPCETTYTFSLADDIDQQVEIVRDHLKVAKRIRQRKHLWIDDETLKDYLPESQDKFVLYLRLLDAEAKCNYDLITWDSEKKKNSIAIDDCDFEQIKRAADSLVYGGYRFLLRSATDGNG
jgi:hypothetical protein